MRRARRDLPQIQGPIASLDFFVGLLRELPDGAGDETARAIASREAECAFWGALLRGARDEGMPAPYLRTLLEIPAAMEPGGALRLLPPTPALAEVARTHWNSIRRAAAAREGRDVDVFIEEPLRAAGACA